MEAAGAIGIAQEAVREVGDKLGSRERAKADNLTFIEVKVEADVSRTLLHKTESRRDCANIASKDAIIKVEGTQRDKDGNCERALARTCWRETELNAFAKSNLTRILLLAWACCVVQARTA